jgi:hypothetical protein
MKLFTIISLSTIGLVLSATISVKAENKVEHLMRLESLISNNAVSAEITPFELVSRAYQGVYQMQGIPGFGSFTTNYHNNKTTSRDLIRAAIEANQLAPEVQNDLDYLQAVEVLLLGK